MASMETEVEHTNGKEGSQGTDEIDYIKEVNMRLLKHRRDVCQTNISSKRSENVKDMSLDDIIADRKISDVPKKHWGTERDSGTFVDRDFYADDVELSLDQIMHKKKATAKAIRRSDADRSLDDIIQQNKKADGSEGGNNSNSDPAGRKRKRDAEDDEDFYIPSPIDVILQLTETGLVIEYEVSKQTEEMDGRSHNWRVKYGCGSIAVQCESARKILAKQGAALELIKRMRVEFKDRIFPECAIPEACYYDPVLCERLIEVCQMMDLETPRFETVQTRKCNKDFFTTTYYIGEDEFIGCSYKLDDSKVMAAKGAYETYAGKPFHRDNYFIGEDCKMGKEYTSRETEATHILTLATPAPVINLEDAVLPDLPPEDEEELLVDDDGRMFIRTDGSNKIRRLTKMAIEDIIEEKLMKIVGVDAASMDSNAFMGGNVIDPEEDDM